MAVVRIALLVGLVALAAACSSPNPPGEQPDLSGTSWTLTEVAVDGALRGAVDASGSLNFASGGALSGSTGCNRFTGSWSLEGSTLNLDPGATTMMACPGELQTQESAVLAALTATSTYSVTDATLTLLDSDGDALATYTAATTELSDTNWRATGVNNGAGAVVTTDLTATLTLRFSADGGVSGFDGCGDFTGTYTAAAPSISITGLVPNAACDSPADSPAHGAVQQQEQYLAALAAATTYTVDGNRLELRDGTGAMQVGLVSQE